MTAAALFVLSLMASFLTVGYSVAFGKFMKDDYVLIAIILALAATILAFTAGTLL